MLSCATDDPTYRVHEYKYKKKKNEKQKEWKTSKCADKFNVYMWREAKKGYETQQQQKIIEMTKLTAHNFLLLLLLCRSSCCLLLICCLRHRTPYYTRIESAQCRDAQPTNKHNVWSFCFVAGCSFFSHSWSHSMYSWLIRSSIAQTHETTFMYSLYSTLLLHNNILTVFFVLLLPLVDVCVCVLCMWFSLVHSFHTMSRWSRET